MNQHPETRPSPALSIRQAIPLGMAAVAAFHLAYAFGSCGFLIIIYLGALFELSRLATARQAFYGGLLVGVAVYAPHLGFFWRIFGPGAITLWVVLAFWIALFLALVRACRAQLGPLWAAVLAPPLWTGLEYFRSELYFLKFSWLNVGYAFSDSPQIYVIAGLGVYGIGFELMGVSSLLSLLPRRLSLALGAILLVELGVVTNLSPPPPRQGAKLPSVGVAGVQMEFPAELEAVQALSKTKEAHPAAQLLVLSEYTLDGPVSAHMKKWCRANSRHLVVGGKDFVNTEQFYNTAFVIGSNGAQVFQQAKSVPIQFFKDGLPAKEHRLWQSPWGRIGLAICYDLSYARVIDRLVCQGAQALVVPTMDVAHWGASEHHLNARVAPMRAAEYGLPIFRVASSGISQLVDERGTVRASAPFPGEAAILGGELRLVRRSFLPADRWLAPASVGLTGLLIVCLSLPWLSRRSKRWAVVSEHSPAAAQPYLCL